MMFLLCDAHNKSEKDSSERKDVRTQIILEGKWRAWRGSLNIGMLASIFTLNVAGLLYFWASCRFEALFVVRRITCPLSYTCLHAIEAQPTNVTLIARNIPVATDFGFKLKPKFKLKLSTGSVVAEAKHPRLLKERSHWVTAGGIQIADRPNAVSSGYFSAISGFLHCR